jgi:hypothetical protein
MKRYIFVIVAMAASAGAVDFGVRVGTRNTDLWPSLTYFDPARCCGLDLLAEIPLGGPFRGGVRAGVFGSATRGEPEEYEGSQLEDVVGLDTRAVLLSVKPVLIEAVIGYAGLGIGYTLFNQWNDHSSSGSRLTENRLAVTVPVGLRYEISGHAAAGAEMETPVFGWFRDVARYGGNESSYKGWRFASFTPSFSAMIVLTPR